MSGCTTLPDNIFLNMRKTSIYLFSDLLLMLTQQYISADPPPPRDEYTSDRKYYKVSLELTAIPTDIPDDALVVNITYNNITTIEADVFAKLSQCRQLYLDHNQISSIETRAFNGLKVLIRLKLEFNMLGMLSTNMFLSLKNCERLWLHEAQISEIDTGSFNGLNKLKFLFLHENLLTTLRPGMFQGLEALTILGLNDGNISHIENGTFANLNNLDRLLLNENELTILCPGIFYGLSSLRHLFLHANRITSLSANVFSPLPRPFELSLYATTMFSRHTEPLVCDSNLCWLKKEEQEGTITWYINSYTPRCANPVDWDTLDCNSTGDVILLYLPKSELTVHFISIYLWHF